MIIVTHFTVLIQVLFTEGFKKGTNVWYPDIKVEMELENWIIFNVIGTFRTV